MKILVFSDSHNNAFRIESALLNHRDVDLIIHLGDGVADIMSIQVAYPEYRYEFIKGNCDYTKEEVPDEKVIEFEGKRVLLIHGHTSRERGLIRRAITENFDVVLYGHTHVANVFNHQDKIFLNPGCVSMPKVKNKRSYAILNIENGEIDYRFIPIL